MSVFNLIIAINPIIISRLDAWRLDESIILGSSSHLQRVYIITTTANTRHLANTSSLMWR